MVEVHGRHREKGDHDVFHDKGGGECLMSDKARSFADLLTQDEVAAALKISTRTLARWRWLSTGPPVARVGRRIYYRQPTFEAWPCAREQSGAQ